MSKITRRDCFIKNTLTVNGWDFSNDHDLEFLRLLFDFKHSSYETGIEIYNYFIDHAKSTVIYNTVEKDAMYQYLQDYITKKNYGYLQIVKPIINFIENVRDEHQQAGKNGHDDHQTDCLPGMNACEKIRNGFSFLLRADHPLIGQLFLIGNSVCVFKKIQNNVCTGGDGNGQCRSKFCQERPKGGDNTLITGAVTELIILNRIHD